MTYTLEKKMLKTGENKGLSIYYVLEDGVPLFYSKPMSVEESFPLRDLVKQPEKMREWVAKVLETMGTQGRLAGGAKLHETE